LNLPKQQKAIFARGENCMELQRCIESFVELGRQIKEAVGSGSTSENKLQQATRESIISNPWFTEDSVRQSLLSNAELLRADSLEAWLSDYPSFRNPKTSRIIGVVTAGNIPLVGFHDFLCVLLSGNIFLGKLSSKDDHLLKALASLLIKIEPGFTSRIFFTDAMLKGFDAVIATGSNNSARHFEYYFRQVPHLIRRNRNAISILSGKEKTEELELLANDIFLYFGLGCRNVSKLYVPKSFSPEGFYPAMEGWKEVINHHHYANNYEYNRAIFLVNMVTHLDNGFLMLREEKAIPSPVSVLHYERYRSEEELASLITSQLDQIQCIVSTYWRHHPAVPFGKSQEPGLSDYADGVDTMRFLGSI
jgi:hypothetical protein